MKWGDVNMKSDRVWPSRLLAKHGKHRACFSTAFFCEVPDLLQAAWVEVGYGMAAGRVAKERFAKCWLNEPKSIASNQTFNNIEPLVVVAGIMYQLTSFPNPSRRGSTKGPDVQMSRCPDARMSF
ncbi:hypothetical protein VFPPC_17564 [Pochonia chlamydosporia 170]|uniref:Uncharacterized protein n=1 Tax=Pochonia chlamydosporia 170 TaxID=1380566 RepID=A0A219AR58_METCM|nr:hypothetical protein VFPPC_17564 [Pochonia chlamydosporia 170]OWT43273.1 hypothetical protein VFPPC_17564 [Pochonia chlamydosporia 170]